jgi:hypothetical protein
MNKEFLKIQKIAGLITESQYRELTEEDIKVIAAAEKIEDKVESDPSIEAMVDKLSDEEKSDLQSALAKLGITPNTSIETAVNKIEPKIQNVVSEIDEAVSTKQKIADVSNILGKLSYASNLIPFMNAFLMKAMFSDMPGGVAAVSGIFLSAAVGAALIGLSKILELGEK